VRADAGVDGENMKTFIKEINIMKYILHPNIVT
jgi:hypothetical protein